MPHLFLFANHGNNDAPQEMVVDDLPHKPPRRPSTAGLLKNIGSLLKRHQEHADPTTQTPPYEQYQVPSECFPIRRRSLQDHASHRKAIPSLPRPQTFRRQESERREKLLEVPQQDVGRRALSADRRHGLTTRSARRPWSPKPVPTPSVSAPEVNQIDQLRLNASKNDSANLTRQAFERQFPVDLPPLRIPDQLDDDVGINNEDDEREIDQTSLQEEYDRRWILNLSMHFRDRSNREKFFVTYAEKPNFWRRLTVSLDYRNARKGSLEADLKTLHFQRDKSFRIYEAIRESLPDIQYYDTVTNLKLETTPEDGQLHVHVREDANEIIQYPSRSLFQHVQAPLFAESDLEFISHLSGFVYKVRAEGSIVIKKEIPGPDSVDEFMYEVNALDSLIGCKNVVQLEGLVTDDSSALVKGLLISYASQGALVDMIYDFRDTAELPWRRREKWAKQIVYGLSEIHEAGFVQGDFTLSNIVIDEDDNAQIIDINRRGCPVGWEPPELGRLIESGQRIGMCIGVKTDLFQLGMVLWALAEEVDEPERVERPLPAVIDEVPEYFRTMVATCLSPRPQGRFSARALLQHFPPNAGTATSTGRRSVDFPDEFKHSSNSLSTGHRSDKEYIDPDLAVTIEDVRRRRANPGPTEFTTNQVTYVDPDSNPATTSYRFESSGSWIVGHGRGRSPVSSRRRRSSPYARQASSATSVSSRDRLHVPARRLHREPICGSEFSGDEKPSKPTMSGPYPPEISAGDLDPPVADVTGARSAKENQSRSQQLRCLDAVRSCISQADLARLVHTDSGFNEDMIDDLPIEDITALSNKQPIDGNVAPAMPAAASAELMCSTAYQTPAASPDGDPKEVEGEQ